MAYVRQTLRVNDLAYIETAAGLSKCKVLSIKHRDAWKHGTFQPSSDIVCQVRITSTKGKNAECEPWSLHVIPRKSIRHHWGIAHILPYDVDVPPVNDIPLYQPIRHASGLIDSRYSVQAENTGHATHRYTARFCDAFIGSAVTRNHAFKLCHDHKEQS